MNELTERFIEVYQHALSGIPIRLMYKTSESELRKLFALADVNHVYPMVTDLLYSSGLPDKLLDKQIKKAISLTCSQAEKSAQFLALYRFLIKRGLEPTVLGGIICRSLYPEPEQLIFNEEKLLISADEMEEYHKILTKYGLKQENAKSTYTKDQLHITLQTVPFPENSIESGTLNSLFNNLGKKTDTEDIYNVPINTPEYTDHLLYLIYSAYFDFIKGTAGIRQISDVLLFSIKHISSIDWVTVISSCRNIHMYEFVSAIYGIGESYLFQNDFPEYLKKLWQSGTADQKLLEDILASGSHASHDDQQLHNDNLKRYAEEYMDANFINQLQTVRQNKDSDSQMIALKADNQEKKLGIVKHLHRWIRQSFLTVLLSPLYMLISWIEYHVLNLTGAIKGEGMPEKSDQSAVRKNVTFIVKSFERQNLVKELCRNIAHMYPGTAIIIADDSSTPLTLNQDNVQIIHLPFNSGLSAGLKAALEEVKTPYIMRMDDDELLMSRSKVHRELHYLMAHPELDLIGFGHTTAIRCRSPQRNFDEYRKCSMDDAPLPLRIPHMTRIDHNHIVLGKVANIYLARTEKIREVGFDPNIKVIDHHDFFWRSAGVITSAIAEDTMVFHRHNPYLKKYNSYRSDFRSDLEYINKRRRRINWEVRNENQIK